jgi:predicted P-loop ATPase
MDDVLDVAARFRSAGFAIHWLHPKTKRPIGENWQDAPVATIAQLRLTHRPFYNIGVRLGLPSKTLAGYLHVLDVDVRRPELADEAFAKLHDIFPGIDFEELPCVISGSGGASRHYHFVTNKPYFSRKLAVSEGKLRTADGKWHYDWEIELFGTGKQVVLPPSIHPDTGLHYTWEREFDFDDLDLGIAPSIDDELLDSLVEAVGETFSFESRPPLVFKSGQLERELEKIPDSRLDDYHDWITLGQALHHQFGGSDEGFDLWMKVSSRSAKAQDNNDREVRRKWLRFGRNRRTPVTMASVRQWVQETRARELQDLFDEEDEVPAETLDDDDGEDMLGTVEDDDDDMLGASGTSSLNWTSLFDMTEEGAPRPCLHNATLIIRNDPRTKGIVQYNEFTNSLTLRKNPGIKGATRKNSAKPVLQLNSKQFQVKDFVNGDEWRDIHDIQVRQIIEAPVTQGGYGFRITDRDLRGAIDNVGQCESFHPVREYLAAQKWDGINRIDTLWIDYLGAEDNAYHRAIARNMMIGAVTRVMEPGHKFDFAAILEGFQGKGKSTFISILGKGWTGTLPPSFDDTNKLVEGMQGQWIMEIGELSGFQRSDVRHIKQFISTTHDKCRLAYAKRAATYARQCIFIGSTNDQEYLKDDTGGRRYWPVRCNISGKIDLKRLDAEVDQMWAEAYLAYKQMRINQPKGTLPLYLADDEANQIAEEMQASRKIESPEEAMAGRIEAWLDAPINGGEFDGEKAQERTITCLLEVWTKCLGKEVTAYNGPQQLVLTRAMRMVKGWEPIGQHRFPEFGKQRAFTRKK